MRGSPYCLLPHPYTGPQSHSLQPGRGNNGKLKQGLPPLLTSPTDMSINKASSASNITYMYSRYMHSDYCYTKPV